jgi:hypothetical protein
MRRRSATPALLLHLRRRGTNIKSKIAIPLGVAGREANDRLALNKANGVDAGRHGTEGKAQLDAD